MKTSGWIIEGRPLVNPLSLPLVETPPGAPTDTAAAPGPPLLPSPPRELDETLADDVESGLSPMETQTVSRPKASRFMAAVKENIIDTGHMIGAMYEDFREADRRGKSIILGALAMQTLERTRITDVTGPTVALNRYETTGNAVEAATILGAIVYGTQHIGGTLQAEAMAVAPKSQQTFNERFPKIQEYAEEVLLVPDTWRGAIQEGRQGISIGTMPFVAAEAVSNPEATTADLRRTSNRVSRRTAVGASAIALTLLKGREQVPEGSFAAQCIEWTFDKVQSPLYLTGFFIACEALRLRIRRIKLNRAAKTAEAEVQTLAQSASFPATEAE